jgi:acyl-CoA thioesterase FadM
MSFAYEVRRAADGALLVSGDTKHISVDGRGGVRRFPETMRSELEARIKAL